MTAKATLQDIAKRLNTTIPTVSRALNDSPRISKATKKAVLKVAKELNYQPNNIAAALRKGKSYLIGVIVPTADRAFFASVIRGIEEVSKKLNYKVIICQSYDDDKEEIETIDTLSNAQVDGIIVSISKKTVNTDHLKKAIAKGMPIVLFDRTSDELDVNQVMIDDYRGAYDVVSHLVEQGCNRIAHFTSPIKISIYKERMRGYIEALKDNGIPFDSDLVIESDLQLEDGRICMEKLLHSKISVDAVFSSSDYAAMGAMQVLKEQKIKIPETIALAGFANEPFTSFTDPTLTTVDQRSLDMGRATAELFFKQLNDTEEITGRTQKVILQPKLIVRQTSLRNKARKK